MRRFAAVLAIVLVTMVGCDKKKSEPAAPKSGTETKSSSTLSPDAASELTMVKLKLPAMT
ncbi:MAG: hypothetical protein FJ297_00155 [Planctomycetes bacterium]|nr:hypothetical protein [Planctomycetota bacterium]